MDRILPYILATLTQRPRYKPSKLEWNPNFWTQNIFRMYEFFFWKGMNKDGSSQRCEWTRGNHYDVELKKWVVVTRIHTFEAAVAHFETYVRNFLKSFKLVPVKIYLPQLATANGVRMPSPYLFAIAFDNTGGKREAGGGSPNTFSLTITGTDLHLWVNTASEVNDVSTCTYNLVAVGAVAGAQVDGINDVVSGPQMRVLINPSTGANNLVTTCLTDGLAVAAASYTGCNQSTATDGTPGTTSQNSGTTLTVTMTVTTTGSWVVAGMNNDQNDFTAGSGTTMRQVNPNYGLADSNGAVATGSQSLIATYPSGRARGAIATILPVAATSAIKTIDGLAKASVKVVNGLAIASVKTWNGLE